MSLSPLPSLPSVVAALSQRPALPQSLNLLALLQHPFLPSPSGEPTDLAPTWQSIETYYPSSSLYHFNSPAGPQADSTSSPSSDAWATFFLRPAPSPNQSTLKISLAFSDPSPTSSSRRPLFSAFMALLAERHAGTKVYFCGLPDGLVGVFEEGMSVVEGKRLSYKVQMRLQDALDGGKGGVVKPLDGERFERSTLREDEVADVLLTSKRTTPASDYLPRLQLTSCIRDLTTPKQEPISWALLYDDLSVAALHTLSTYRSLSLASHTIHNMASHLADAFARLPEEIRPALDGDGAWIAADWDDGNPAGKGFFAREGWELLEEGVRWAKGTV